MDYKVGQIIYVILKEKATVYPVQIVEEVTKKSINKDTDISYIVKFGTKDETIALDKINGEIHTSLQNVRKVLIDRASMQIDKLVASANAKATEWFGDTQHPVQPEASNEDMTIDDIKNAANDDDTVRVQLSDGTYARIKIPDVLK